jgi:hypothetical protein
MRYWTLFSSLFRSHRYSPEEKLYSVTLFTAGLSIREMKEGTKRFYNNVNSKKLKSVEEVAKGNTNLTVPTCSI